MRRRHVVGLFGAEKEPCTDQPYTHTHAHMCTHTLTDTHAHRGTHTQTHTHTHTHIFRQIHDHTHTHMHTNTCILAHK